MEAILTTHLLLPERLQREKIKMPKYAHVQDEEVVDIIIADEDHIASRPALESGKWVLVPEDIKVGINFTKYDKVNNRFMPPQAYPGWVFNESAYRWEPPNGYPADGEPGGSKSYSWDEETNDWKEN
mgnify:CR=1 FL=1